MRFSTVKSRDDGFFRPCAKTLHFEVSKFSEQTAIFDQMSQEHIDYMLSKIPRGRFVEVQEISSMIAWMASSENSFTTGAVFDLSGGRSTY